MRDKTLEERIESILYAAGVKDSGALATAIIDEINDHSKGRLTASSSTVSSGGPACPSLWDVIE